MTVGGSPLPAIDRWVYIRCNFAGYPIKIQDKRRYVGSNINDGLGRRKKGISQGNCKFIKVVAFTFIPVAFDVVWSCFHDNPLDCVMRDPARMSKLYLLQEDAADDLPTRVKPLQRDDCKGGRQHRHKPRYEFLIARRQLLKLFDAIEK